MKELPRFKMHATHDHGVDAEGNGEIRDGAMGEWVSVEDLEKLVPPAPQTGEPLQALARRIREAQDQQTLFDIADELEALAESSALAQPQWRDIATAPKDGTEILLSDGKYKRTGYWAKRGGFWSVDTVVQLPMPTHWLALPLLVQPQEKA